MFSRSYSKILQEPYTLYKTHFANQYKPQSFDAIFYLFSDALYLKETYNKFYRQSITPLPFRQIIDVLRGVLCLFSHNSAKSLPFYNYIINDSSYSCKSFSSLSTLLQFHALLKILSYKIISASYIPSYFCIF